MAAAAGAHQASVVRLLGQGNLADARVALRSIIETSGDAEARLMLGRLAYVATDYAEAQQQLEAAYHEFLERGAPRRAAVAATELATLHIDGLEQPALGRGWLSRAERLIESEQPCVEQGHVLLGMMGASVASADELSARAGAALEIGRRFQDRPLECKALGDWGLALVSMGNLRDGFARLDEACTMIVSGECADLAVTSQVLCGMVSACDRSGDVARATSWLPYIEDVTSTRLRAAAVHTLAHCWSAYGSLLCRAGRYLEGEIALRLGLTRGERAFRHARLTSRAALADLCIRQGRLEEAERLLDADVDRVEVMGPRARLLLALGRHELAAAVARLALAQLAGDRLRAAPLLLVVVDADLNSGNADGARDAAAELERLADEAGVPAVSAQAALALGRVAAAADDDAGAAHHFDHGLRLLADGGLPHLRADLFLNLARARAQHEPAAAIVAAEAALHLYRQTDSPDARAATDLLRRLGHTVAPAQRPPGPLDALTRREREVLSCLADGLSNPEIASRLFITPKTAEHHVGSILGKLGVRNRTEAAAFAASFRISPEQRAS